MLIQFSPGDRVRRKMRKNWRKKLPDWSLEGEILEVEKDGTVHVQWDEGDCIAYPIIVAQTSLLQIEGEEK